MVLIGVLEEMSDWHKQIEDVIAYGDKTEGFRDYERDADEIIALVREHVYKNEGLMAYKVGVKEERQRCIDAGNNLITEYPETDFDKTINQGIRLYQEALEKQD